MYANLISSSTCNGPHYSQTLPNPNLENTLYSTSTKNPCPKSLLMSAQTINDHERPPPEPPFRSSHSADHPPTRGSRTARDRIGIEDRLRLRTWRRTSRWLHRDRDCAYISMKSKSDEREGRRTYLCRSKTSWRQGTNPLVALLARM